MQIDDSDIEYLSKTAAQAAKMMKDGHKAAFRLAMREETCILLINLAGYRWDADRNEAYKVTATEKREYFNARTTDSTSK